MTARTATRIALRITGLYLVVRGLEVVVNFWGRNADVASRIASSIGLIGGIVMLVASRPLAASIARSSEPEAEGAGGWTFDLVLAAGFAITGAVFLIRGLATFIGQIGFVGRSGEPTFSDPTFWSMVAAGIQVVVSLFLIFGSHAIAGFLGRLRMRADVPDEGSEPRDGTP